MKITIYELLGMIKDGEAPYKVKYKNEIYIMDNLEYFYVNNENKTPLFESIFDNYSDYVALNEEVEILDNLEIEKKIPEKLTDILRVDDLIPPVNENMYKIWAQTIKNHNKINSIIDYLKSKGE